MNKKNKNCCCMLTLQHLNIVYGKRIILWLHSQWIYRLVVVSSCCILFNKLYFLVIMFQAKIFEYFLTASFQFLVESLPLFAHRIYSILNMDEKMLFFIFFFFSPHSRIWFTSNDEKMKRKSSKMFTIWKLNEKRLIVVCIKRIQDNECQNVQAKNKSWIKTINAERDKKKWNRKPCRNVIFFVVRCLLSLWWKIKRPNIEFSAVITNKTSENYKLNAHTNEIRSVRWMKTMAFIYRKHTMSRNKSSTWDKAYKHRMKSEKQKEWGKKATTTTTEKSPSK